MMTLTHWTRTRNGVVAGLRCNEVTTTDGLVKDQIGLLPNMTKDIYVRTVFISAKLKQELQV